MAMGFTSVIDAMEVVAISRPATSRLFAPVYL